MHHNYRQDKVLSAELTDATKHKIDFLIEKLMDLNLFEMRYLSLKLKERIMRGVGINPLKINLDWPSVKMLADGTWPPMNPNWFKQQEIMAKLGPFMAALMPPPAPVQTIVVQKEEAKPAPEAKKEEPRPAVEKAFYDIEMTSYNAAAKIRVIKEYRAIVGLGLKEAKEKVEKVPFLAFKGLKKDEADELVKKFEGFGAKMKLL